MNIKLIGKKSLPPLMTVQVLVIKQINFAICFLLAVCLMLKPLFILTSIFWQLNDTCVFSDAWEFSKRALVEINL